MITKNNYYEVVTFIMFTSNGLYQVKRICYQKIFHIKESAESRKIQTSLDNEFYKCTTMRFFSLFTVLILCSALHLSVAKNLAVDDESTGTLIQVEDVKQTVSSSVDFAIGSSFVPSYVRQALATGKV